MSCTTRLSKISVRIQISAAKKNPGKNGKKMIFFSKMKSDCTVLSKQKEWPGLKSLNKKKIFSPLSSMQSMNEKRISHPYDDNDDLKSTCIFMLFVDLRFEENPHFFKIYYRGVAILMLQRPI
jgi:hypothetical protein